MIGVIQRVSSASVTINEKRKAGIERGILLLLGIEAADNKNDIDWLSRKVTGLRIFDDDQGIMNLSVKDIDGEILVVSQFTLHASTRKGNRPSYSKAAGPEIALPLYEDFLQTIKTELSKTIESGEFGANMQIELVNDGPVTILIDTKDRK